jgi:hypothetical protein
MPQFELRACSADDLAVTYGITRNAMRAYVQQTWGSWDEAEQSLKHRQNYTPETYQLKRAESRTPAIPMTRSRLKWSPSTCGW